MKSYNVISQVELVAQVCCADGPITQPTYFFFFTIRMPQNAQCVDVRVPVRSCTSSIQSSSIIRVRMAVQVSVVFK